MLEIIFGKDVANIIYRYVWIDSIKTVNKEYLKTYRVDKDGVKATRRDELSGFQVFSFYFFPQKTHIFANVDLFPF